MPLECLPSRAHHSCYAEISQDDMLLATMVTTHAKQTIGDMSFGFVRRQQAHIAPVPILPRLPLHVCFRIT